jgi:Saxitoxin biosynthesis operon protein SxtJ
MEHASPPAAGIFPRHITKEQCKDTGMAMVLICLLLAVFLKKAGHINPTYLVAAIVLHVVNMTAPRIFHCPAIAWFGFSHLLGTVMSKVLLTGIFLLVVTPIAIIRRMMGRDALKLRQFKVGGNSVMVQRDHTFTAADISKPY